MRVISQDGTKDFPYDSSLFFVYAGCINGRIYVRMQLCGGYDDSVDVADYSTKEKAVKAMEMLRQEYLRETTINQTKKVTDEIVEITGIRYYFNAPKVFQFPQDDEIEV